MSESETYRDDDTRLDRLYQRLESATIRLDQPGDAE
jgi:hypothetical protein